MPRKRSGVLGLLPPLLAILSATFVAAQVHRIADNTRACERHLLSIGTAQASWFLQNRGAGLSREIKTYTLPTRNGAHCPITGSPYQVQRLSTKRDTEDIRVHCPGCDRRRQWLSMRPAAVPASAIYCFAED